ncbi:cytosine deaminase [Amylocystis lapponica]|nr:cytosine deaminase [Amylocystis lapponica]
MKSSDVLGLSTALAEAKKSYAEGGVPIGAALVLHGAARARAGHNQRVQKASAILHGETSALKDAGRLKAEVYRQSTMYTTLSPCSMCSGAILLYKSATGNGENINFKGEEDLLRSRGVEVVVLDNTECKELMTKFIRRSRRSWYEDIGEIPPQS